MGRKGSGVEIREASIRIKFSLHGVSYRERVTANGVALAPTVANIKYANRLACEVRRSIELGTFRWEDYFPDSKHSQQTAVSSFGTVANQWLATKGALTKATQAQYANAVRVWLDILGDVSMEALTYQTLASRIGGHPWASGKLANNYLIPLRGIFAFYYAGARSAENPCAGIKNLKFVKPSPDPLSEDERDAILQSMAERYDARVWAYFAFAFYTGMRPEEIIALQWGDVDFGQATIRVQRVRTFKGSEREGSKTHTIRDVDLVAPALQALRTMKPYTFMKQGANGEPANIFENPVTCRHWHDERSQRDHYWKPTLKLLGIRERRAYNTRHTYATVALMGGVNPHYIARQMGHKTTKLLFDVYSKWIDGADKGAQRKALEQALSSQIRPSSHVGDLRRA